MICFWITGTVSGGSSTPKSPRATMAPSLARTIESRRSTAPGVSIESASRSGGFELRSGTSNSTAVVSGVAALVLAACVAQGKPQPVGVQLGRILMGTAGKPLPSRREHPPCREPVRRPCKVQSHQKAGPKHTSLFDGVIPDAPPAERTVIAPEAITAKYLIKLGNRSCSIERWEFDVLLHSYHPRSQLTLAASYSAEHIDSSNNETLVTVIRWQGTDDDVVKELIVIAIPKDGKSYHAPNAFTNTAGRSDQSSGRTVDGIMSTAAA